MSEFTFPSLPSLDIARVSLAVQIIPWLDVIDRSSTFVPSLSPALSHE